MFDAVRRLFFITKSSCYGLLCFWLVLQIKLGTIEDLRSTSQSFIEAVKFFDHSILILTALVVGLEAVGNLCSFFNPNE